jgi:hypothetical protein
LVEGDYQLLLGDRTESRNPEARHQPPKDVTEVVFFVESQWFAGQKDLTPGKFDRNGFVVHNEGVFPRRDGRRENIGLVDNLKPHVIIKEVLARFNLNILEIWCEMEPNRGIGEDTRLVNRCL